MKLPAKGLIKAIAFGALLILAYAFYHRYLKKQQNNFLLQSPDEDIPLQSLAEVDSNFQKGTNPIVTPWDANTDPRVLSITGHFNTGSYVKALDIAQSYLSKVEESSFSQWLTIQMPILLTATAWFHLKSGDCEQALALFLRSESFGKTPASAKGLAYCYQKQYRLHAAERELHWYLKENPSDISMQHMLLDLLESEGRFDDAVSHLDGLLANQDLSSEFESLTEKRRLMGKKAEERGLQEVYQSRFFYLSFRSQEHASVAEWTHDVLTSTLDEYVEWLPFQLPKAPIEVIFYPATSFQDFVPDSPGWAEGLFDGRIRVPIRDQWLNGNPSKELRTILRHELTHALFAQMSDYRKLPNWFNEGIAQRAACHRSCSPFYFGLKPGPFLPPKELEDPFSHFDRIKAKFAYEHSLYLIYTIETHFGGQEALQKLVGHVNQTNRLDSNELLGSIDISFQELHEKARGLWQQRISLVPQSL